MLSRTMTQAKSQRALGLDLSKPILVQKALEKGLPYDSLKTFSQDTALPVSELSRILGISENTLLRRKNANRLETDESDRLLRIATLHQLVLELFHGRVKAAFDWLTEPHPYFDGDTPLDMAKTEYGAKRVETLVQRLIHGVLV